MTGTVQNPTLHGSRPPVGEKACTKCGVSKPLSNFSRIGGGKPGVRSRCKPCTRNDYRDYTRRDPEAHAANRRASRYRTRFQMSMDQVDELFRGVDNRCESCGIAREETPNRALVLDHDHSCCPTERTCGKCVRGVLCTKCNIALGALDDSSAKVRGLMNYAGRL